MSQLFDKIKVSSTKRSIFDLSHNQVTTSDFGYLLPICCREMVPNDDFVVKPDLFVRLAPLAVPVYGRIKCRIHHFFVPYRVLYGKWDLFITQDKNNHTVVPYLDGQDIVNTLSLDPQFNPEAVSIRRGEYCKLMSNFGLNPMSFSNADASMEDERISMFPFLAYYKIWLDWFADSNIINHSEQNEIFKSWVENGGDMSQHASEILKIRSCCFKKDYFTTAKVNPQDGASPSMVGADLAKAINPGLVDPAAQTNLHVGKTGNVYLDTSLQNVSNSKISQFTIEALRAANSLQRYLERNNFVGSKLMNRLLAHFGVAPSAERLDMSEFVGGDSFPIQIGDVTATSSTYLGMQAGKGVGASKPSGARYHAKEHGVFISLLSILPDTGYYQGVSRFWNKIDDPLDFFTPEFENLGYQEVLNKEVYVPSSSDSYSQYDKYGVFGYTPRYSEYKFANDVLGSDFIGETTSTPSGFDMDSWHLFRKFKFDNENPLALNEHFTECDNFNNDYDRIFQVTSNEYDHFYFSIHMDIKATRPMDGFTAPALDSTNEGDGNAINLPYGGTRL